MKKKRKQTPAPAPRIGLDYTPQGRAVERLSYRAFLDPGEASSRWVSELVAAEKWGALEGYCESDAVGCWLAAQFWNGVQEPGFARQKWRDLARWVTSSEEHPGLRDFSRVSETP